MKKLNFKTHKNQNGITLVALVITIIILLILAGIAIASFTGDNGLITRAQEARTKTDKAQEREGIEIAVASSRMEDVDTLEITEEKLSDAIKQQFGNNKDFSITDNEDGSFLVSMNDTQRMYYIDETGEIIDQSKILKISTADELKSFRDDVNSGNTYEGWYIYLANDITLDINEEWQPIGNRECIFQGIFDGNKFEINGIYINTSEMDQGLFGYINNATVKKLGIGQNCNIVGGNYTGSIVGTAYDKAKIIDCYNKSYIHGNAISGGIAGQLTQDGLISQCYNIGSITVSNNYAGGICGSADNNSTVEKCYNISTITGNNYIGGIVGYLQTGALLQNCYNTGSISGSTRIGGICGEILGQGIKTYIKNSYNIGSITGTDLVCGIARCWDGGIVVNSFYLENSVNGSNDNILNEGSSYMSSNEIKQAFNLLGESFKEDVNNINNGYPILNWQ